MQDLYEICRSVVRVFAHDGAMGDHFHGGSIELFLVPSSAP